MITTMPEREHWALRWGLIKRVGAGPFPMRAKLPHFWLRFFDMNLPSGYEYGPVGTLLLTIYAIVGTVIGVLAVAGIISLIFWLVEVL